MKEHKPDYRWSFPKIIFFPYWELWFPDSYIFLHPRRASRCKGSGEGASLGLSLDSGETHRELRSLKKQAAFQNPRKYAVISTGSLRPYTAEKTVSSWTRPSFVLKASKQIKVENFPCIRWPTSTILKVGVDFKIEISIYQGMVSKLLATLSSLLRASYVPGIVLDMGDMKIINKTKSCLREWDRPSMHRYNQPVEVPFLQT